MTARYLGCDDTDGFHDGWLRTGDVGTLCARGYLTLTDRAKDVIKSGGEWISSVALENISGRDKIWFHPTFNLRRDTTSDQLLKVLSSMTEILCGHPKVEAGRMPVRFVGVGAYSLDIDAVAYVTTADYDEFLALQQELLLKMLQAVEQAGTALAVPLQESFAIRRPTQT